MAEEIKLLRKFVRPLRDFHRLSQPGRDWFLNRIYSDAQKLRNGAMARKPRDTPMESETTHQDGPPFAPLSGSASVPEDSYSREGVQCPWCGVTDGDSWERQDESGVEKCDSCGQTYEWSAYHSVSYSARPRLPRSPNVRMSYEANDQ